MNWTDWVVVAWISLRVFLTIAKPKEGVSPTVAAWASMIMLVFLAFFIIEHV